MWTTPEKHTMKRETLRNANQNKTTRRAGYKKVYDTSPSTPNSQEAFKIKGALFYEMLNKTKTPTTTARKKKAKEKVLKWTSQTGKEPYENDSEKKRVLQNAKNNNKTTKKKSSDSRRSS